MNYRKLTKLFLKGAQCEKCKPLYVGDPSDGGQCVPCSEYCFGHTSVCVGENSTEPDPPEDMDFEELAEYLKIGPKGNARCIRCNNRTAGNRCDECITGKENLCFCGCFVLI